MRYIEKIKRKNASMSNDKQCNKTLSPKVLGFLGKDKLPISKSAPKKLNESLF